MTDATERLLVEAAQKDPRRFADLYEENFHRVYAFVARRVENRPDAEDLTSEVFQQALANLGRFEWRGVPFAAWLYKIASNAIADRWERAAKERRRPAGDDPPAAHHGTNPEEIERRARLFRLVEGLPMDQRRVIEMRFAEGRCIAEIARELKRSDGAVKQLQFRGIARLRVLLDGKQGRKTAGKSGKGNG
jgi:RNA polymerase sigma-70 factor (ECF subfamily)